MQRKANNVYIRCILGLHAWVQDDKRRLVRRLYTGSFIRMAIYEEPQVCARCFRTRVKEHVYTDDL